MSFWIGWSGCITTNAHVRRCTIFKNTASQKLTVLAFADAGHASLDAGEIVTGDSANITLKVEQDDDGTQSASNDTNPTEVEDGQYRFDLTQAETNGDKLTFYPESSTAGVQVVALPSNVIYTRPPNFPALGIESDGDLTQVNTLNGHTAQTGDSYSRLGAPAGASVSADIAAVKAETATIVVDTNELQTNQGNWLTATGFSTHSAADVRSEMDSNSTQLAAIVADTNELQGDWVNGGRLDVILDARASQSSVDTIDGIVDAILVDTGTTLPSTLSGLATAAALATVDVNVDTINANVALFVAATQPAQEVKIDAIKAVTDNLPDSGALSSLATAAALTTVDGVVDAILVDTGTTIPAQITALNNLSTSEVNSEVVDALQTDTPVAGVSIAEALRRIGTITDGKVSGAGTGTETFTDWADSANTIVITVDASGNRTGVTYN